MNHIHLDLDRHQQLSYDGYFGYYYDYYCYRQRLGEKKDTLVVVVVVVVVDREEMIEYDENFLVFRKTDQRWRKDFHFFIFIFAYVVVVLIEEKTRRKKLIQIQLRNVEKINIKGLCKKTI